MVTSTHPSSLHQCLLVSKALHLGFLGSTSLASCPLIISIIYPHCQFFRNLVCPVSTTQNSPKQPLHWLLPPSVGGDGCFACGKSHSCVGQCEMILFPLGHLLGPSSHTAIILHSYDCFSTLYHFLLPSLSGQKLLSASAEKTEVRNPKSSKIFPSQPSQLKKKQISIHTDCDSLF